MDEIGDKKCGTHSVVGCTSSRWSLRSVGIEYESVRTISLPESVCSKTVKSASRSSFALLTGTEKLNQSPAGDAFVVSMLFSFSHALTASTDSCFGVTKSSTC